MSVLTLALACAVALAVDRWLGEPGLRWHPVVWMGNFLGASGRWVQRHTRQQPQRTDLLAFGLAALVWLAGAAVVVGLAWLLQDQLLSLPWWAAGLALGLLLKPLLAWAMLKSEVLAVEQALAESLEQGRARLAWLVSRDVNPLSATQVHESAIETLAENLNDSVVAPLFWFVVLGLPGAALYRFANTADAMWGYPGVYKGSNWAWAGKWAARADDVLSWLPARITALCLLLAAGLAGLRQLPGLAAQARRTPSPNSGWPMAAMALVLGVALGKPGVYVLNPAGGPATAEATRRALGVGNLALGLFVLLGAALLLAGWQLSASWGAIAALLDSPGLLP